MGLAFGEHNDLREIPDEMLLGERVETTGEQAYFNEIERLVVVRSAAVVVGVFSDFMNPAHRLLSASGLSGISSQNMSASVSFAITACCTGLVNAPRRSVRLIQGMGSPRSSGYLWPAVRRVLPENFTVSWHRGRGSR